MGKIEYEMFQEIPKEELEIKNDASGISYDLFKTDWLPMMTDNEFVPLDDINTPKITYIMYDESKPIGRISVRPLLNDYKKNQRGHIKYVIRPTSRNQKYGTIMLSLALEECRKLGMPEILLQCGTKNKASRRVIEKNGGQILSKIENDIYIYKILL